MTVVVNKITIFLSSTMTLTGIPPMVHKPHHDTPLGTCTMGIPENNPRQTETTTKDLLLNQQNLPIPHKSLGREILRKIIRTLSCRRDMRNFNNLLVHLFTDKMTPHIYMLRPTRADGVLLVNLIAPSLSSNTVTGPRRR